MLYTLRASTEHCICFLSRTAWQKTVKSPTKESFHPRQVVSQKCEKLSKNEQALFIYFFLSLSPLNIHKHTPDGMSKRNFETKPHLCFSGLDLNKQCILTQFKESVYTLLLYINSNRSVKHLSGIIHSNRNYVCIVYHK